MTDEPQWQSPGGNGPTGEPVPPVPPVPPAPPAPPGAPSFPPIAPGYIAQPAPPPHNGAPPHGYGQGQPGWTPPPKPGLIPLRPLDVGTILGSSFRLLRRNPRPTFGAALVIQGIVTVLFLVVVGGVAFAALSRVGASTSQNQDEITAGAFGLIALSAIIPVIFAIVASAVLQGVIVLEVSRGAVGEKSTFRQLWSRARGRIGALVGWTLLIMLAVAIFGGIFVGIIVALASTAAAVGIALAVIFGIFGVLGAIVLSFWLGTKLSLVPSALMIERLSLGAAIARSWSLTQGAFWRVLGIQLLVSAIVAIVGQIVSIPLNLIAPLIAGLIDPNNQDGPTLSVVLGGLALLSVVLSVAFGAITAVVQTATTALIYLDRRIRKEGLDLELAHFVEARQAGDTSVVDPLLHTPATGYSTTQGAPPTNGAPWS